MISSTERDESGPPVAAATLDSNSSNAARHAAASPPQSSPRGSDAATPSILHDVSTAAKVVAAAHAHVASTTIASGVGMPRDFPNKDADELVAEADRVRAEAERMRAQAALPRATTSSARVISRFQGGCTEKEVGTFVDEIEAAHAINGVDVSLHFPVNEAEGLVAESERMRAEAEAERKRAEAAQARPSGRGSSRFRGVSWQKSTKKWLAQVYFAGNTKHVGSFVGEIEAALAIDAYAITNGVDQPLNFPDEGAASVRPHSDAAMHEVVAAKTAFVASALAPNAVQAAAAAPALPHRSALRAMAMTLAKSELLRFGGDVNDDSGGRLDTPAMQQLAVASSSHGASALCLALDIPFATRSNASHLAVQLKVPPAGPVSQSDAASFAEQGDSYYFFILFYD